MYIIGIAGGTGSGKTTVVRKIVEALPVDKISLIPQDSYYNDTTHLTMEERRRINFDHPDAFDWELLTHQIEELRNGRAIEQPTYSYIESNRQAETVHVEPCEVIIIEGIMALFKKELRDYGLSCDGAHGGGRHQPGRRQKGTGFPARHR